MLLNLFRLAFRNLINDKLYSLVSFISLTVGFTACLIIGIFVFDETHYDQFHKDHAFIYRIGLDGKFSGRHLKTALSNPYLMKSLRLEVEGVEATSRLFKITEATQVSRKDSTGIAFKDSDFIVADSNFFQFFSFRLLEGDPKQALSQPNQIVLTQAISKKLFGREMNVVGEKVFIDTLQQAFTVSGICASAPANSHIQFQALLSWSSFPELNRGGWMANSFYTYLKISPGTSPRVIEDKLAEMTTVYVGKIMKGAMGITFEEFINQGGSYRYFLYPMSDTHLNTPDISTDMQPKSEFMYVFIFIGIGVLILIICSSNFLNLATARSITRTKEISLRRSLGSMQSTLIVQFLVEAFLYVIVSLLMAIVLAAVALPFINSLIYKSLSFRTLLEPLVFLPLIIFTGLIIMAAGAYPVWSFVMYPKSIMQRGNRAFALRSKRIKQFLIILQFTILFIISFATIHLFLQISYLQNKSKGINEHQVVVLKEIQTLGDNYSDFIAALQKNDRIKTMSATDDQLPDIQRNLLFRSLSDQQDYILAVLSADVNYQRVLELEVVEGHYFSSQEDTLSAVINEATANELGLAIGKSLSDLSTRRKDTLTIIGIVKDFRFDNFQSKIRPLIIKNQARARNLLIRYSGEREEIYKEVLALWGKYQEAKPVEVAYMEDQYQQLLDKEKNLQFLFALFTMIILLVSLIGLNAMSLLNAEYRVKEIAVRKVMGASTYRILLLLCADSSRYIIIAFGLALLPAYYLIGYWLQQFDDHISVSYIALISTGVIAYCVSILLVAYISYKTSNTNPVNLLRYE